MRLIISENCDFGISSIYYHHANKSKNNLDIRRKNLSS